MMYFPVSITVRQLSKALKKAGLIPPSFDPKSEKQFMKIATDLKFHKNEVQAQIEFERTLTVPCKQEQPHEAQKRQA